MFRYIIVSVVVNLIRCNGWLINANPLVSKNFTKSTAIAKTSMNVPAGIVIVPCVYRLLCWIFLISTQVYPGELGLVKRNKFAVLLGFSAS